MGGSGSKGSPSGTAVARFALTAAEYAEGMRVIEEIARKAIPEVWFNPGSADDALVRRATELGLKPIEACSIIGAGLDPYAL